VCIQKPHMSALCREKERADTMLVNEYRLEILNNECMPSAMSLKCFAHLDQDVIAEEQYE